MPDRYTKNYAATTIYKNGTAVDLNILVAREDSVELFVNGTHAASILSSPAEVKELAVGHVICEGITGFDGILNVQVNGMKVDIHVERTENFNIWHELRSSGGVGIRWQTNEDINVTSDAVFSPESIYSGTRFLESDVYRLTNGTHLAALVTPTGELAAQAIDIGRHNAIDKVIGHAALSGLDVSGMYLLSTGRQSAGMVLKAARAGVPLVVTKSAPFDSGIEAAKRTGVGLVAFLSGKKMSVFANKWRVAVNR